MKDNHKPTDNPRASPIETPPPTVFFDGEKGESHALDHSHRKHSLLSASSSKRWLNCPPSAVLNDRFPDKTSVYAAEGTAMHERCEWKLRTALGERMEEPHSEFDTEETEQVTDVYAEFCLTE
ncbi:MAG: DUF2800 domain-containing protein, partial [Eggerthellaceae bacterium]|nr:DUF2800 domain-containing protein [Eggerthellaceae bacterium]